jgi:hypothetical protein
MYETIKVTCPCCKTILIVDRKEGKVLEERRPLVEESSGDRFQDAMRKVREQKEFIESKVRDTQKRQQERKAKLDKIFEEEIKRAKEEGPPEKPFRPSDLD